MTMSLCKLAMEKEDTNKEEEFEAMEKEDNNQEEEFEKDHGE